MTYACTDCGEVLDRTEAAVVCPSCGSEYPDDGGFYDFLGGKAPENEAVVSLFDSVASLYETPLWYPLGMRFATGGRSSVDELVDRVAGRVAEEGAEKVVDVATGTGLFARRIARGATVYGVDASAEMLRRAARNARRDGVVLELARADAGALPYADAGFDAAVCCGALHVLPEPSDALREMGRVVREDGTVVLTTLVDRGIFGARAAREAASLYGVRVFGDGELDGMLGEAGFERVETVRESSLVTLVARRR